MPRATFFMPFLCHNFSQIFELSNFFQNLTRKVFKKLLFYLINSKLTKSRTFESNTAPPHINNFPRTQGFKSRTNWRYPAHSGNSVCSHSMSHDLFEGTLSIVARNGFVKSTRFCQIFQKRAHFPCTP